MSDTFGLIVGLVLTLAIFSYLLGDNPLYRLAVNLLVGVSAAYAAIVAIQSVLWPPVVAFIADPAATSNLLWLIPLTFALLLLLKTVPRIAWLGNGALAFLVGIGAAVAITGAVAGTLVPQTLAILNESGVAALGIAILTVCTLLYFQFTCRSSDTDITLRQAQQPLVTVGHIVLTITFGALFAAALSTSLLLLTERVRYFVDAFLG